MGFLPELHDGPASRSSSGVSALLMSPLSTWPRAAAIHASFREVPPAMGRSPPSGIWPERRCSLSLATGTYCMSDSLYHRLNLISEKAFVDDTSVWAGT